MQITLKQRIGNQWQIIETPKVEAITPEYLRQYENTDTIIEYDNGKRKLYGIGNESQRGKWCEGKIIMLWPDFVTYWQYTLLNFGLDTFAQAELKTERVAIMEVEKVEPDTILSTLAEYPERYGATADQKLLF